MKKYAIDGNRVKNRRIQLGLTQDALALKSSLGVRTIQRIEVGQGMVREDTLRLLAKGLNKNQSFLIVPQKFWNPRKVFLTILLNFLLVMCIGFLTLDATANLNSRVGAFVFIGLTTMLIFHFTPNWKTTQRIFFFGWGYVLYLLTALFLHGLNRELLIFFYPYLFLGIILLSIPSKNINFQRFRRIG